MIAYDIDGVMLPDSCGGFESRMDFLQIRASFFVPMFTPQTDFYLITGRPEEDLKYTKLWIDNYFKRKPLKLFHGNPELAKPGLYKASVINDNPEITTYIESSPRQTAEIIENLKRPVKVIHFETMIHEAIAKILSTDIA
jgi:hypothetical protein